MLGGEEKEEKEKVEARYDGIPFVIWGRGISMVKRRDFLLLLTGGGGGDSWPTLTSLG